MKRIPLCVSILVFLLLTPLIAQNLEKVKESLPNRPSGCFLRITGDGNVQIYSVGISAYNKPISNTAYLQLENIARQNAQNELSKFIKTQLSSIETSKESYQSALSVALRDKEIQEAEHFQSAEEFTSIVQSNTANLISGMATVHSVNVTNETGGFIKVLVCTSTKTLLLAKSVSNSGLENTGKPAAENTAPDPISAEGMVCLGKGEDREKAVTAAILEGIRQVYGVSVENDEVLMNRFKQVAQNGVEEVQAQTGGTSSTLSSTRGFVREYRIVDVKQLNDSIYEATVKVWIVNPRSGGIRTILFYPMVISPDKQIQMFNVGPKKRMSGEELTKLCTKYFERAFNKTNRFAVLNQEDINKVLSQKAVTQKVVDANIAAPGELVKVGQVMTADYIFTSSFNEIIFKKKIGMNKETGRFESFYTVTLSFDYKIIDVATGTPVKNETRKVALPSDIVTKLIDEDNSTSDIIEQLLDTVVADLTKAGLFK